VDNAGGRSIDALWRILAREKFDKKSATQSTGGEPIRWSTTQSTFIGQQVVEFSLGQTLMRVFFGGSTHDLA
jgi:hypothetical protein